VTHGAVFACPPPASLHVSTHATLDFMINLMLVQRKPCFVEEGVTQKIVDLNSKAPRVPLA
jgi:hypothetical protein